MTTHSVYLLHAPYPDGSWRGLEKCSGATDSPRAMFRPGSASKMRFETGLSAASRPLNTSSETFETEKD